MLNIFNFVCVSPDWITGSLPPKPLGVLREHGADRVAWSHGTFMVNLQFFQLPESCFPSTASGYCYILEDTVSTQGFPNTEVPICDQAEEGSCGQFQTSSVHLPHFSV